MTMNECDCGKWFHETPDNTHECEDCLTRRKEKELKEIAEIYGIPMGAKDEIINKS